MIKANKATNSRPWHSLPLDAICDALASTEQGLSQQEAQQRLTHY
ncbi:cation-transporting P-type ATPase, partial [Methyloglobulus morosus]